MARQSKKTETLEIPVSAETKSALQAKARADGKTVSEALRQLIARYLDPQAPALQRRRNIMRLSSLAAGAAALLIAAIALTPAANAGGMLLGLSALIDLPATPGGAGARTIEASVALDFGKTVLLCVPAGASEDGGGLLTLDTAECAFFNNDPGYAILLSANAAPDDSVLIRAHVLSEGETTMPETASAFLVKLDSWAAMQIRSEAALRLSFFPRRL